MVERNALERFKGVPHFVVTPDTSRTLSIVRDAHTLLFGQTFLVLVKKVANDVSKKCYFSSTHPFFEPNGALHAFVIVLSSTFVVV